MKIIFCLLIILCLNACSTKDYHPYPIPNQQDSLSESATKEAVQNIRNWQEPKTVKSLLSVRAIVAEERNSFRQSFLYKNPDLYRFETYPLRAAWASNSLVLDGHRYQFVDTGTGDREEGEYHDQIFMDFFHLPLSPAEILAIILGYVPKSWTENASCLVWNSDNGHQIFQSSDGQRFWEVDQDFKLTKFYIYRLNSQRLIISGEILLGLNNLRTLQIEIPRHSANLNIAIGGLMLNQEIPTHFFEIML